MPSDPDLLREYAENGSEAAFAELVRRNVDFVYRVAIRQARQPQRAEDATQAVFVDLARKAKSLYRRTDLTGWLFLSARFAALSISRQEARRQSREMTFAMQQEHIDQAAPTGEWRELQPFLDEELEGLARIERDAVLMRYFKGASYPQIAEALAMSEEGARKRVDRALNKLRAALAGRGHASTSAALTIALGGHASIGAPAGLAQNAIQAAISAKAATTLGMGLRELLHIMTTSKAVTGLVLAAGLVALGGGIREAWLAHETSQKRRSLSEAAAHLDADVARGSHSLAQAQQAHSALEAKNQGNPGANGNSVTEEPPSDKQVAIPKVDDPQMRALALTESRAETRQFYGAFFAQMKWNPAQIEAFLDARGKYISGTVVGEATFDVRKGHPYTGYDGIQVGDNDWAGAAAAEKTLIGDGAFQQLQEYEKTEPYRELTSDLASKLYDSTPLTGTQGEQLVQLWTDAKINFRQSGEDNWQGLVDKAKAVLTASQLEIFQRLASAKSGNDFSQREIPQ